MDRMEKREVSISSIGLKNLSADRQGEVEALRGLPPYAQHDDNVIKGFFGAYSFLSNFFPAQVNYEGMVFPSTENAYQAQKVPARFRSEFLTISPSQAKEKVQTSPSQFLPKGYALEIMRKIVEDKFRQSPTLAALLVNTRFKYLEQTNSWGDTFWGVSDGCGLNHLGKILMQVRRDLVANRYCRKARLLAEFGRERVFVPVIHLHKGVDGARKAVDVALEADADGVFLINQGMESQPTLELAEKLQRDYPRLWLGINLLGYDLHTAVIEASHCGARGLWVDDGGVDARDSRGTLNCKNSVEHARNSTGWLGLLFGGTAFKTQAQIPDNALFEVGAQAASFMDVVTTSGPATNSPASLSKIKALAAATDPAPLALASGVRPENVEMFLPYVDAYLVASGIERELGVLDPLRTQELSRLIHQG